MAEDDRPWKKQRDDDDEAERPRQDRRDDEDDFDDYDDSAEQRKLPREWLREIARNQKAVICCIGAYGVLVAAVTSVPEELHIFLLLPLLGVIIAGMVFVFRLALLLYSQGTAVVLTILMLLVCVNLIVLLVINGKATSVLKENGIPVGFFGANSSDI